MFQTSMQANEMLKNDFRCMNCGEHAGFTKKLYCKFCTTAEQRKLMQIEQEKIKKENLAKGFIYAN